MSVRAAPPEADVRRARVRVEGTVQGVGFRPYVYRLACELDLGGFVQNDSRGVLLEVEGDRRAVAELLARLAPEAPPLAVLERAVVEDLEPAGSSAFEIVSSPRGGPAGAPVTADTATCAECLGELCDPRDRRHRYPFINCTNCGPRFTIVRGVPYDRQFTTMAGFRMCASCQAEYDDPRDRRFHAQPNACPRCGPRAALLGRDGAAVPLAGARDAVHAAALALRAGRVLAVKGIGGYHLACRADHEPAVAALRARKHREDKPFALMVRDLEAAGALVDLGADEIELLTGPARPIVLAGRRADAPVAASVAAGTPELGVMLPYSPLHHLLLADAGAVLVMTSGNAADEPIAFRDGDALERLATIADLFLVHDRPIETRTDDSVVRMAAVGGSRRPAVLRRSRGHVPASLPLLGSGAPLLACGAELKNTFCLAKDGRAWVSHHIGDLESYETLCSFAEGVEHFQRLFDVTPRLVVHDLHPEYLSTKYAQDREGVELVGVQHHHAHLAAVLAEHRLDGPVVGAIFDGTGYGTDGTVWGGELLVGGLAGFERAGSLRPVRMPGGAAAIREPWRMACAWLAEAFGEPQPRPPALAELVDESHWTAMARVAASPALSPATTSIGRLFDAVAALCGLCARITYEGQAAILLEAAAAAAGRDAGAYELALLRGEPPDGRLELDPRAALRAIAADTSRGVPAGVVAARFHAGLADVAARACMAIADRFGLDSAVLGGGVFHNRLLLAALGGALEQGGLRVLTPERLPAGDGGISFGQAAVAAARAA
jgi:hydrogenase maturation protein HypF